MKHNISNTHSLNLIKRLHFGIFVFLCFFIPFQTRIVFFTGESSVSGLYSFYNTLFFYFSDLLVVVLVIFWFYSIFTNMFHVEQKMTNNSVYVIILSFFVISVLSYIVSRETIDIINIFGLIKLFLILLLFCFTINMKPVKQMFHNIFWLILASSVIQSIISIFQYFLQGSLGLKILGEEYINNHLPGIASFKMLLGQRWIIDQFMNVSRETLVIRPYGTFPHPNVLGAFMAFSALLSVYLFIVSRETWKKVLIMFILALQLFGLTISFSRVGIISFILGFLAFLTFLFLMKQKQGKDYYIDSGFKVRFVILYVVLVLVLCFGLFYPQYLERTGVVSYGTSNREAIEDRVVYQNIALNMIKERLISGVGFQNYVRVMDDYSRAPLKDYQHQPVHNIYLLIAAETGLAGLVLFLILIYLVLKSAFKNFNDPLIWSLTAIFLSFLFIGLFDHYFFTIQQGRLMFFLVAGLLMAASLLKPSPPGHSLEQF